jgi:hypothetical protein
VSSQATFNASDFENKFRHITKTAFPADLERGMGIATTQLMNDAVKEVSTVPFHRASENEKGMARDGGLLRGSGSSFVGKKRIAVRPKVNGKGEPSESHDQPVNGGEIMGVVGFNTSYAAKWHETPANFTERGAGNFYLSSKLAKNKNRYMEIVAAETRKG